MELGMPELVIILVLVLLLFGPSKLPTIGEGLGKALRGFKDAMRDEGGGQGERPKTPSAPDQAVDGAVPPTRDGDPAAGSTPPRGGDPAHEQGPVSVAGRHR